MEERTLNISFNKTGNGYLTPKLAIPKSDLEDMGITPKNRSVKYYYNKETKQIIIEKNNQI